MLLLLFKFGAPLFFGEVLFEILLDFLADEGLSFEDALIDAVEKDEEHEGIGGTIIKFILLFLWLVDLSRIHWYEHAAFNIFLHFTAALDFQLRELV